MDDLTDLIKEFGRHIAFETVIERMKFIVGLIGSKTTSNTSIYRHSHLVACFPRHRKTVWKKFYEAAFESGGEVLYVSVMSNRTLDGMARRLEIARKHGTTLKVLTWDPDVGRNVAKAFSRHLGEFEDRPGGACAQTRDALNKWQRLAAQYPTAITGLRKYDSVPTMQGVIVKGEWALIELYPYHVTPDDRPALFLTPHDRGLFKHFCTAFEELFSDASPVDVQP
jgi:hypothetical protein